MNKNKATELIDRILEQDALSEKEKELLTEWLGLFPASKDSLCTGDWSPIETSDSDC